MHQGTLRHLERGDEHVQAGEFQLAVEAYAEYADACLAQSCIEHAKACWQTQPLVALRSLAQAERFQGVSFEGRALSARIYEQLGEHEIAARFRLAVSAA